MKDDINTTEDRQKVYEDFSPRKFILQTGELIRPVLRRWYIPVLAGLAMGIAAYFYYTLTKKPEYVAEISFVLDEEIASTKKSGLSEITEQLGLGPSDAGALLGNEGNFAALLTSRFLTEQTLREKTPLKDTSITFADFFLDSLGYRKKWASQLTKKPVRFDTAAKNPDEQLRQNSIIAKVHELIISEIIKIDKKSESSIIFISCTSVNELFSKMFLEKLIDNVTGYYLKIQTEKSEQNLKAINHRLDSVKSAYVSSMYGRASIADANLNLILQKPAVSGQTKQTDVDILRSAYVDLSLSLESAKTTLLRKTPVIQILDAPMLPLKVNSVSGIQKFILFFVAGAFLTSLFLFMKSVYRFIMKNP